MKHSQLLNAFLVMHGAQSVKRYSRDEMVCPEDILQHTGGVALWCLICALDIKEKLGVDIDLGKLLSTAVLHDLDEVGTGDIPRITKYASSEALDAFKLIEHYSVAKIADMLEVKSILPLWITCKDNTLEGVILKYADVVTVVYKIWHEVHRRNNYSFLRVAHEVKSAIDSVHKSCDGIIYKIYEDSGYRLLLSETRDYFNQIAANLDFIVTDIIKSAPEGQTSLQLDISKFKETANA